MSRGRRAELTLLAATVTDVVLAGVAALVGADRLSTALIVCAILTLTGQLVTGLLRGAWSVP